MNDELRGHTAGPAKGQNEPRLDYAHLQAGGIRRLQPALFMVATLVIAFLLLSPTGAAHKGASSVPVQMPFSGKWGNAAESSTDAGQHHTPYGGHWSVDLFAPAGTSVKFPGTGSGKVIEVKAACKSGKIADGGWRVKVEVRDSSGFALGWMVMAHIDAPTVKEGEGISGGKILGKTKQWEKSPCYSVSKASGVHVHLEAFNYHQYTCYKSFKLGQTLSYNTNIGTLGNHGATKSRTKCA